MPALAETQARFRAAISGGAVLPALTAPVPALLRMDIYRRHYRESFRRHLRGRFPTLEWLIGTPAMTALADATLRAAPPRAPSLAEYGAALIDMAAARDAGLPAYAADVARLNWALGRVSVAIAHAPLPIAALATVAPERLDGLTLQLQPGLDLLAANWPVDELVHLHLGGSAPEQLAFAAAPVWLAVHGARGSFRIDRLTAADFAFRAALQAGRSLGDAAAAGLAAARDADLTQMLAALFAEGLVIDSKENGND